MYERAKNYASVGEVSKAMAAITSNGIALVDNKVLKQLQSKHPPRHEQVTFQPIGNIKINDDVHESNVDWKSQEFSQYVSVNLYSAVPSVTLIVDDILSPAKTTRRLRSVGLQQISPWHLKRAHISHIN